MIHSDDVKIVSVKQSSNRGLKLGELEDFITCLPTREREEVFPPPPPYTRPHFSMETFYEESVLGGEGGFNLNYWKIQSFIKVRYSSL